ncbi:adf actin-binding protein [Tubulinosema ratisbonensis]|uniref:Adf actin-binding protein n=1 Tax=Tubulinosema ratisbonensis TaxID=291195 RepID=A0A437ALT5_9MICR|nr:adf actin-binding protein [Tubulinosema ratisbonensis]
MPELSAKGFVECQEETNKVKSRRNLYYIFTITPLKPLTYKTIKIKENTVQKSARDTIEKNEAIQSFSELKSSIKEGDPCFIVYDFPFFSEDKFLGNVLCLFSYIPDNIPVLSRVAFSTSSLDLPVHLGVAKHFQFHSTNEIDFMQIHKSISAAKRN